MKRQILILLVLLIVSAVNAQTEQRGRRFGEWSMPVNLGPPINSTANENSAVLSRDGLTIYFSSDRTGSEDIWFAKRKSINFNWEEPINLGKIVNSASIDRLRSISSDGRILLFQSNRLIGSQGGTDIWASIRNDPNNDFGWSAPVNLGTVINTAQNEIAANYLFGRQGLNPQLFFSSVRPDSMKNSSDIYLSEILSDGTFGAPVNVAELNSSYTEACFWVREDGLEIFFSSSRTAMNDDLDSFDIWTSTRSGIYENWSPPVRLTTNTPDKRDVGPYLSANWTTMYFTSNRSFSGGLGGTDIYVMTRRRLLGNQ